MSIIELRQTSENDWKARYNGNYGIYTIKITRKGKKTVRFSCTCPSDYYPCKHVAMIEEAIEGEMGGGKKTETFGDARVRELINAVPEDKLRQFVAAQVEYNPELRNAVFLEFAAIMNKQCSNKYSAIIKDVLNSASLSSDEYYSEYAINIDGLDQWLDKAADNVIRQCYDEAIFVCKAIIEEFSDWLYENEFEEDRFFSEDYYSVPFEIIERAAKHADRRKLFDYCLSETKKKKYGKTVFYSRFQDLLGSLAPDIDPGAFLDMQDKLLADVPDKSSREAEIILLRKAKLFENLGDMKKALEIVEANIQIPNFRLRLVENRIEQGNFSNAKKLVTDFIAEKEKIGRSYKRDEWHDLLLKIAQKENDIPAIQNLAYGFIEDRFDKKYFQIYKATFTSREWAAGREKLFLHYNSGRPAYYVFSDSAADLLVEENDKEQLLLYMDQHPMLNKLEKYHKVFEDIYPERTLELFRDTILEYAEQNIGRTHYEYILDRLKDMAHIKGGKEAASTLATDLKAQYKNRRAMIETLNRFQ